MRRGRSSPRVRALLDKLANLGPLIQGSLHQARTLCGRQDCVCRTEGKKHPTWRICWKKPGGESQTLSIPLDLVEEVRGWADEWKRAKALLKEISEEQREFLKAIKRKRGPGRPRKACSKPSS